MFDLDFHFCRPLLQYSTARPLRQRHKKDVRMAIAACYL
jgi:hypothetical protein